MTPGRWGVILALLVLVLAAGLLAYNLNRGPSGPQPTGAPIHLY
jgi:hypothetical protein